MKASENLNVSCRRCARGPVHCIQPSRRGAYLRCAACGEIWLEDGRLITRRSPATSPRRRKSDRLANENTAPETGQVSAAPSLHDLVQRIAQLEEENRSLREAARAFGELAERLTRQLRGDQEPPKGTPHK